MLKPGAIVPKSLVRPQGQIAMGSNNDTVAQEAVFCMVPAGMAELERLAVEHFADRPDVEVITDQRRRERRRDPERRRGAGLNRLKAERRLAPGLEARRVGHRRDGFEPVDPPDLPPPLRAHLDQLRFVRRAADAEDAELTRLRMLVRAWQHRADELDREAGGLLQTLIGTIEDLRQFRSLSPRWFAAVRRADRAIDAHRERRLTTD